eukprot:scaffold2246_cov162-Amphora_coffeaeformis.AAC.24
MTCANGEANTDVLIRQTCSNVASSPKATWNDLVASAETGFRRRSLVPFKMVQYNFNSPKMAFMPQWKSFIEADERNRKEGRSMADPFEMKGKELSTLTGNRVAMLVVL